MTFWGREREERIDSNGSLSIPTAEGASSGGPFLCGALETSVVLLQWYQPMNKFLLVRVGSLLRLASVGSSKKPLFHSRPRPNLPQGSSHLLSGLDAPPAEVFPILELRPSPLA